MPMTVKYSSSVMPRHKASRVSATRFIAASCAARPCSEISSPPLTTSRIPATRAEVMDDGLHCARIVSHERAQCDGERRGCRWSSSEGVQDLPVTPRQAVRIERPFERTIDQAIEMLESVTNRASNRFH
jgi:hypothetical protein